MSFEYGWDYDRAYYIRRQQEDETRQKAEADAKTEASRALRARVLAPKIAALGARIEAGNVSAMRECLLLLAMLHGVKVTIRESMPAGAAAYALWSTREIVVPPIKSATEFAYATHEMGHILAGRCTEREPHRRDPTVREWWHCVCCESNAWEQALRLVPFSPEMKAAMRRGLRSIRRSTPASAAEIERLDRMVGEGKDTGMSDIHARTDGTTRIISGIAIPFNALSVNLGGFVEKFAPSSVDRTIRTVDVRMLAHHDAGRLLGRLSARTLKISKSQFGLSYSIELPDTTDGRDAFELVQRRDLTGASFAFTIAGDGEEWDFSQRPPLRIVTDARISELSLVSWPAYTATTAQIGTRQQPAAPTGNRVLWLQRWARTQRAKEERVGGR
jgi:uncharacterized protein